MIGLGMIEPHEAVLICAYPEPFLPVQENRTDSACRRIIAAANPLDGRSAEASNLGLAFSESQKSHPKATRCVLGEKRNAGGREPWQPLSIPVEGPLTPVPACDVISFAGGAQPEAAPGIRENGHDRTWR